MAHVKVNRQAVIGALDTVAFTGVRRLALEYQREVKRLMRDSPASGRVYVRGGRPHRASAPGEPPAADTTALVNAVTVELGRANGEWAATCGVGGHAGDYARALEYGAPALLPRPTWRPAFRTAIERGEAILAQAGAPTTVDAA